MVRYTLLRILIFLGSLIVLWLAGLRSPDQRMLLLVGAVLMSMVISWFGLRAMREDLSAKLAERIEARAEEKSRHRKGGPTDEEIEDAEISQPADQAEDETYR